MKIIRDYNNCPTICKGSVIALGNFDGVHKGHLAVIEKAREIAAKEGLKSSVLTFEPHPLNILKADIKPFRLTTEEQKTSIIQSRGIHNLFIINFDKEFSEIKAGEFIEEILVNKLQAAHIVTGEDFIFGHKREGNRKMLSKAAKKHKFGYTRVRPVGDKACVFSSSLIRKSLQEADLLSAAQMLGRNFFIAGTVQEGNKKGRELGFPTINIPLCEYIRPAYGVYAVKIYIENRPGWLYGAANIGVKPTLGGTEELLEVHIFDFSENIYGHNVEVELIEYIRPERKFMNLDELKSQIAEDCVKIREIFE